MAAIWQEVPRRPRRRAARLLVGMLVAGLLAGGAGATPTESASTEASDGAVVTPDGGRYRGPLVDGLRSGKGRVDWENGAYFEGNFDRGLYDGAGHLHEATGEDFEGVFERGLAEGRGRQRSANGTTYEGPFHAGHPQGNGRLDDGRGNVYEGQFVAGQFEGQGRLSTPQGEFEGHFHLGRLEGIGSARYRDGRRYQGEFAGGRFEGRGRYESAGASEVYEGQFVADAFTGEGTFTSRSNGSHTGHFVNWRPDGPGRYIDPQGDAYEGRFSQGSLDGAGVLRYHDGARYEGEFKGWLPSGAGVLVRANGDAYRGSFAHGVFDGPGTLTFARPRPDGRTQEQGTWHLGHLGGGVDEAAARANVESALYLQPALLARRLDELQPRRPGAINLFLLEVAGDGSQEVFHREVDFVQAQFAARFGTQGHAVQLVNSRNTIEQAPLATVTSIRRAVAAIAARMDREEDILFVFLTSHGSRDHRLLLDLEGMPLPPLEASELGRILRESGIRWKIVVVSACYGGGFIEPLDDGHTLVITAARSDRRSFGCSDDSDFTYFGRAFFEQALPAADSLQDAFARASTLITHWEDRDRLAAAAAATAARTTADGSASAADAKPTPAATRDEDDDDGHSLPQMRCPEAVRLQLEHWWAQRAGAPAPAASPMPNSAQP